jgi:DNA end-binding protein Ku
MRSGDELVGALPRLAPSDKKLRLAAQLIESWRDDDFDLAQYEDHYLEKVQEIVAAKRKGEEVVAPEAEEADSDVINLMDALKKSLRVGKEPNRRQKTASSSRPRRRGSKRRKVS